MKQPDDITHKAYSALNEEEAISVPPELDAAILAKAKAAVATPVDQPAPDNTVAPLPLTSRWRRYAPGVGVAAVVVLSVSIMVQLPQDNLTQSPPMPSVVLDEAFMESPEAVVAMEEHASMPASPLIYAEDALTSNIDLDSEREREQQLAEARVVQAEAQKREESQAKEVARARLQETEQRAKPMMAKKQTPTFDAPEARMLNEPAVSSMALLQHDVMLEEQIEPRYRNSAASWQSHIEQLVKDKQFDEAEAEFVLFKAAFPDHPFTHDFSLNDSSPLIE